MDIDPRLRSLNDGPGPGQNSYEPKPANQAPHSYPEPPSTVVSGPPPPRISFNSAGASRVHLHPHPHSGPSLQLDGNHAGPPPPPPHSADTQPPLQQYYSPPQKQSAYNDNDAQTLKGLAVYAQQALPDPSPHQQHGQPQQPPPQHYGMPHSPRDPTADLKRPRACEACRQLKVRCEPGSHPIGDGPCKRCEKADRACIVTAPTRKRQKKADNRVAELERKIDALTASLQAKGAPIGVASSPQDSTVDPVLAHTQTKPRHSQYQGLDGDSDSEWQPPVANKGPILGGTALYQPTESSTLKRRQPGFPDDIRPIEPSQPKLPFDATAHNAQRHNVPSEVRSGAQKHDPSYIDFIDRGVMDMATATRIFNLYVGNLATKIPIVIFPATMTAGKLRQERPYLFLAIIAASCGTIRPDAQTKLTIECLQIFADHIIVKGWKSLEIVQALLIYSIWFPPPDKFEDMKIWQLTHLAAAVATDIGLGKRVKPGALATMLKDSQSRPRTENCDDLQALEERRAWAGCYLLCSSFAIALRRPAFVRWHSYMDETIEILLKSPHALPTDKTLTDWLKLQHILEEISFRFGMDDPASTASLAEPLIQHALKAFERQLEDWRIEASANGMSASLRHFYGTANLFLHEIGMHLDHNIDDFKPPFINMSGGTLDWSNVCSPPFVEAITACVNSCHDVMDTFATLSTFDIQMLPSIHYARTIYALVALIKIAATISLGENKLGEIITLSAVKIEEYIEKLLSAFRRAQEAGGSRCSDKFMFVAGLLISWYYKRTQPQKDQNGQRQDADAELIAAARGYKSGETPLHMLSEVAMKNKQRVKGSPTSSTVKSPGTTNPTENSAVHTPQDHSRQGLYQSPTLKSDPANQAWADPYAMGGSQNYRGAQPTAPNPPNPSNPSNLIPEDINSFFQGTDLINMPFAFDDITELGSLMDTTGVPWSNWEMFGGAGGF